MVRVGGQTGQRRVRLSEEGAPDVVPHGLDAAGWDVPGRRCGAAAAPSRRRERTACRSRRPRAGCVPQAARRQPRRTAGGRRARPPHVGGRKRRQAPSNSRLAACANGVPRRGPPEFLLSVARARVAFRAVIPRATCAACRLLWLPDGGAVVAQEAATRSGLPCGAVIGGREADQSGERGETVCSRRTSDSATMLAGSARCGWPSTRGRKNPSTGEWDDQPIYFGVSVFGARREQRPVPGKGLAGLGRRAAAGGREFTRQDRRKDEAVDVVAKPSGFSVAARRQTAPRHFSRSGSVRTLDLAPVRTVAVGPVQAVILTPNPREA